MGKRKDPKDLETVAFDDYFYTKDPDKVGGRSVCRNTGESCQWNDYAGEEARVQRWKKQQIRDVIAGRAAKALNLKEQVFVIPKK